MSHYYILDSVTRLDEGLYGLRHVRWGRQLWTICKVRKDHKCVITGKAIKKGEQAYRPITTNGGNRYERIVPEFFEAKE